MDEGQQNVTRTFPETEPLGLDRDTLRSHLTAAIDDYHQALSATNPPTIQRTIYRPNSEDNGGTTENIAVPNYFLHNADVVKAALQMPGISALFDYVWERGELRRTLIGPVDDLDRFSWESFHLHDVLHGPLADVLTQAAFEDAIDNGYVSTWRLPTESRSKLIDEVVVRCCDGIRRFVVTCPLMSVHGASGDTWDLGNGVFLKLYSRRDKAIYYSRNHDRLLRRDLLSIDMPSVAILEIIDQIPFEILRCGQPPKLGSDLVEAQISDRLDVVKWALAAATGNSTPLTEATVCYENMLGGTLVPTSIGALRRERKRKSALYTLDATIINTATELIQNALSSENTSADLRQAIWHWGRACLANTDRDILLESVIGLERLLVRSPGESRYKFGLHGAALLATDANDAEAKAKELRRIYEKRSSAAHGKNESNIPQAFQARNALREAIRSLLDLIKSRRFTTDESVAQQIERLVLEQAVIK